MRAHHCLPVFLALVSGLVLRQQTACAQAPPPAAMSDAGGPGTSAPTVRVAIFSTASPLDVALLPDSIPVPRANEIVWSCRTPCTLTPQPGRYQLVTRDSSRIAVRRIDATVSRTYRITAARSRASGLFMLGFGLGAVVVGAATMVGGMTYAFSTEVPGSSPANSTPYLAVGISAMIAGVGLIVPGIVLLARNGERVETSTDPRSGLARIAFGAAATPGGAVASATFTF